MVMNLRSLTVPAATALILVVAGNVRAQSFTPLWIDASWNSSTGITLYNYSLQLQPNTAVNSTSSFTFEDFSGVTGTPTFTPTATGANFGITVGSGSTTPISGSSAFGGSNVVMNYDGTPMSDPLNAAGPLTLGTVSIASTQKLYLYGPFSPYNAVFVTGSNAGMTYGPSAVGPLLIPAAPFSSTPEPGVLALLSGFGCAGITLTLRRRRKSLSAPFVK